MDELLFFWKLLLAAIPPAVVLTMIIMTLIYYGGSIIRYIGRLTKWLVMMIFDEPEAAHRVTKTWRSQQK